MHPLSNDDIERLARRRAGAKMGWYIHATVYLLVNGVLWGLSTQGVHRWSVFPAMGWGLGLLLHGLSVWVFGSGSGLREWLIQRERERLQRQRGPL